MAMTRNGGMEAGTIQKELSCLGVGCDTLEEREGIANAVRHMCCQVRRGEHWVYRHNLLEESWHDTWQRSKTLIVEDGRLKR